jgi:hypothetical protein
MAQQPMAQHPRAPEQARPKAVKAEEAWWVKKTIHDLRERLQNVFLQFQSMAAPFKHTPATQSHHLRCNCSPHYHKTDFGLLKHTQ